jgi:GH24 family phage-related lysozyme (muramidase)
MIEALALLMVMVNRFKVLELVAYQGIVGVWTIGYRETLGVHAGMVWTQQEAEEQLKELLAGYLLAVLKRWLPTAAPRATLHARCLYRFGIQHLHRRFRR